MNKSDKLTRDEWVILLRIFTGVMLFLFIVAVVLWFMHRSLSSNVNAVESEHLLYPYCGRYNDPQSGRPMIVLGTPIQDKVYPLQLNELNARGLEKDIWYEFIFVADEVVGYRQSDTWILNEPACD